MATESLGPRMRRRNSLAGPSLAPMGQSVLPGDNKPTRIPRFEQQLAGLLATTTGGRVAIAQINNDASGTEFILTPNSLDGAHRAALEAAVPRQLHALWRCEQRECMLPSSIATDLADEQDTDGAGGSRMRRSIAGQLKWQTTLVVCRRPAAELPRPLWLTASYVAASVGVQVIAASVLYWSLFVV